MPSPRAPRLLARVPTTRRAAALVFACLLLGVAALLPRASHGSGAPQSRAGDSAGGGARAKSGGVESAPGEILVRFRADSPAVGKGAGDATLSVRAAGRNTAVRVERFDPLEAVEGLRLARVAPEETAEVIAALRAREDVLYAEPNFLRRVLRAPNDPRYPSQWGLKNTSFAGFDIGAEAAWDVTTGSRDVVVGVVDEGIDISHEDLRANVWTNPAEIAGNGIDDDGDGYVDDTNGWDFYHNDRTVYDGPGTTPAGFPVDAHGTHVAGIIGAQGDNSLGVAGVNWQVSLMSLKFIGPDGGRTSDLLRALSYAKWMRDRWQATGGAQGANLRVLNNSYGGAGRSQAEEDAIRALSDSGILFVAAAGNSSSDNDRFPSYPASYDAPNVVAVAGTAQSQSIYGATNYGARSVHVYAPAQNVLSTTPGNTYTSFSGTSMASPHAAGVAALVCAAQPSISMARLRAALIYGGSSFSPSFAPTITGRQVNAAKALQNAAEVDTTPPGAPTNLHFDNGRLPPEDPLATSLFWAETGDDDGAGVPAIYEVRFSESPLTDPAQFDQATRLPAPTPRGTGFQAGEQIHLPFRHPSGFVGVRAVDNAGNAGAVASIPVSLSAAAADPYVVSESAPEPLSTGGTPLNLHGDDSFTDYSLPFAFTYFNTTYSYVRLSTNGVLYFGIFNNDDSLALADYLPAKTRVAGLWDDLRTDRRPGDDVYVVQPDEDRVIFRWQAVTYNTPLVGGASRGENPVNFEIELRRDGTIITRYGDGNQNLFPVVGLGGGEPDPYLVGTHTSDIINGGFKSLANAATVTYARRAPTPPPRVDLALTVSTLPAPPATGQQVTFSLSVRNNSTSDTADHPAAIVDLPPGLTFVSCAAQQAANCSATASGALFNFLKLAPGTHTDTAFLVAQVTATPGSLLTPGVRAFCRWADPDPSNNTVTLMLDVVALQPFDGFKSVSAGQYHSLGVKTDGTVWAWGYNTSGQLGTGSFSKIEKPFQVPGLSGVTAVSAGAEHSLALKSDGTVWAWGANQAGQLGVGDLSVHNLLTPTQVPGLSGVIAVATGFYHNLALKSDGTVWAWGLNGHGESGGGQQSNTVAAPRQVSGVTDVVAVAAFTQSLALKSDGTVWAWGANDAGQAGVTEGFGSIYSVYTPTRIAGLSDVTSVAAAGASSIVAKRDGTVWDFGHVLTGENGNGQPIPDGPTPRAVYGLSNVTAVEGGQGHALALKSDGTLWTWGLVTGVPAAYQATKVLDHVATFSAGYGFSLAVLDDGSIRGWGRSSEGQLVEAPDVGNVIVPVQPYVLVSAAPVTLSPSGGSYGAPVNVRISNGVPGAIIRYTTNGQDPTVNDAVLNGSTLTLGSTATLKARAWKDGQIASTVATASYTISAIVPSSTLRFQNRAFQVSEGAGRAAITVIRIGDTSTAASVDYATVDDPAPVRCDDTTTTVAFARCDYATTVDTLRFAPGEVEKSFSVPVVDDAHAEQTEIVNLRLSNPVGASLDPAALTAQLFIVDNDAPGATNPYFSTDFFVRQQYLDFLSREPDPDGFDAWRNVLNRCPEPFNADPSNPSASCDRVIVSSGFFRSTEFQLKGYYVFRFYMATLGRMPTYTEMVTGMRQVTGQTPEEVFARRDAFARDWLARGDFRSSYDKLSNAAFVYTLFQTAGVSTAGGASRDSLAGDLQNGRKSRAEIVRLLVESTEVDAREFNPAFVAMQYFGYLRRDPDPSGYADWLNYLNAHPSDFRTMVNGFVYSPEYKLRFGQT